MSLSEKFEYLIETKRLIKEAIKAKGVAVSDNDTFRSYATKIGNIQGGDITTTTHSANLTEYVSGTDLGNGFTLYLTDGTAVAGSETISGETYTGLDISGDVDIKKTGGTVILDDLYQTAEFEFIEKNLTYHSGYNTVRITSTGSSSYAGSTYFSADSDYMHFCHTGATLLDPDHQIVVDSGNLYDTTITKASVMNQLLKIKYVKNEDYITLYVNDVARLRWDATSFNTILATTSITLGANGIGQNDMLVTKVQYSGNSLSYKSAYFGTAVPKTISDTAHFQYAEFSTDDYSATTAFAAMMVDAAEHFTFDSVSTPSTRETSLTYGNATAKTYEYDSTNNSVTLIDSGDYFNLRATTPWVAKYIINSKSIMLSAPRADNNGSYIEYTAFAFGKMANDAKAGVWSSYYSGNYRQAYSWGMTPDHYVDIRPIAGSTSNDVGLVQSPINGIYQVIYGSGYLEGFYQVDGAIFYIAAGYAIKDE
jgi:hypothetical protein